MKNTKSIFKICYKVLLHIFALIGFALVAMFVFFYFDKAGNCLDVGGVWDSNRKECRYDCDKWQEDKGYIVFDKTN